MRRDPRQVGEARPRWTRAAIGRHLPWLPGSSLSGSGRTLRALGVHWTRAREHVHSPDPAYDTKRAAIAVSRTGSRASAGRRVTLVQDEVTLHRQPSLATAWTPRGREQLLAERS